MSRLRARFFVLVTFVAVTLVLVSCGGGDGQDAKPTPAATNTTEGSGSGDEVIVTTSGGCFRPPSDVESEARARVHVTLANGSPVIGAQVDGEAEGPGLVQNTATDATYLDGDAMLSFEVSKFGSYTMTVVRITLPDGSVAEIDPSSVLQVTNNVGQVCTPP